MLAAIKELEESNYIYKAQYLINELDEVLDMDGGCIFYIEGDKEEKRLWQLCQLD